MKLLTSLVLATILLLSCSTDPLVIHKRNWDKVTRSISSYKPTFKECKKDFSEKMNKPYIIYTFNIKKDSAKNVLTFNDPYKLPNSFHKCVRQALNNIDFKLGKAEELRNGYLLINKDVEKFNYVLY